MSPSASRSDEKSASPDLSALTIQRRDIAPRKGRFVPLVLLVALAGASVPAWSWYQKTAPLVVEAAVVSSVYPSQALTVLNAIGYVTAQRKASVASKATGRLVWLVVQEGSKVRAGDMIARLESDEEQAMYDQASANVELAQANLDQGQADVSEAQKVFSRAELLSAKKLIGAAEYESIAARIDKARAALAGYQAAVAVAQANLRLSKVALDQTVIRAPFDGVVLTRNANVGDTIIPFSQGGDSKGTVVTIADMQSLELEADVAEQSFLNIQVGQPVEVQLDALPDQRFEGEVNRILPTINRATASILVKIHFKKLDPRILPEMGAKVAFLDRPLAETERAPVLALPAAAVVKIDGQAQVYIIKDGA
jgi:RND family efflux transporter MFP subunit